jgi:hypothetical protein
MKSVLLALSMFFLFSLPSWARDPASSSQSVHIEGSARAPAVVAAENCVEVEIGGEKAPSFACVNQRLQQEVDRLRPIANIPPLDASSPAVRVHGFNETALQQQFGQNFGKSAVPFRPRPPIFVNSLGPR